MSSVAEPLPAIGLGVEHNARPEACHGRRNSTPVISLDFSDAMCAVEICGDESFAPGVSPWTCSGTIRALLVVFELSCPSEEDCAVSCSNLEKVLRRQLCSDTDDNLNSILDIINAPSSGNQIGDGRVDFFSYWQSMDSFFDERGLSSQAEWESHQLGVVEVARQLRDQVLATYNGVVSQESPIPELLMVVLEGCIDDECGRQDLVSAFLENGMTLPQFGGMIYACLKKHCEVSQGDDIGTPWDLEDRGVQQGSLSPTRHRASLESTPWPTSPVVCHRRRSSLATDADDGQPIHELAEIVERSLGKNDKDAHLAIARLIQRYELMSSRLKQQQDSVSSMEAEMFALGKEREELQAELLQAKELCEDVEEWKRESERHRQRAAGFEKQVSEIEEQHTSADQSLKRLQSEHRETSRELADCQRRYTKLREHCDRLELSSNTSEEKMRELELAAQSAERKSMQLTNDLDKLSFHSNLAKVLQRRCTQLATVEEMTTNVEPADSRGGGDACNGIDEAHSSDSSEVAMLKQQLAVQQTQLQSLRTARDEIFTAQDSYAGEPSQSKLLAAQLRAMLQHTRQLERLLDSGVAPTASHAQEQVNHVAFSLNLADQLATHVEDDDIEEPYSPGKSPARESTVSTSVSSGPSNGTTFTRTSLGSISGSNSSRQGEDSAKEDPFAWRSGLQIETSPKKKLLDSTKNVMRAQRFGNALKIPESKDKRRRNSSSPSAKPSRRSSNNGRSESRTKVDQQEQDSWMPSLSGLYTVIAGPTSEDEQSSDEEERRKDHHRSRNSSHKHHRSEMLRR